MFKAVVMAGGLGTRMRPTLAPPINKHLCPVAGKPLIHYPLELLAASGVVEVLILLNGSHPELIMETVENGTDFNMDILYAYTKETHGASVGKHLLMAEQWVGDEPFLLLLGDSVYFIAEIPALSASKPTHSWVMQKPDNSWDDVTKYADLPDDARYIQTGLWLFDKRIFAAARSLANTNELRIRHLVQALHDVTPVTKTVLPEKSFIDCGTTSAVKQVETMLEQ